MFAENQLTFLCIRENLRRGNAKPLTPADPRCYNENVEWLFRATFIFSEHKKEQLPQKQLLFFEHRIIASR
jgi:hypothetical protein